jgi:pimeloyl-ACP methyl ester carboxylesterase
MRGAVSRRNTLWAAGALAASATFGRTSWADSAMPALMHRRVETNGLHLHVAEQGEGPLVILCHGFPECWYSWRHQLPALAKAGFRAVAPDLRGYGRSDRPDAVENYTILHDIGDMVGLVDALGEKQAVIVGHDVGATIAWQAAALHPDRFRAVVALSVPFRQRGFGTSVPPTRLMPQSENAVFYQLALQGPGAEAQLGSDLRRTFRGQFYALSGNRSPTDGGFAGGMVPRNGPLLSAPEALPSWITESDIDVYVAEFTRSGLRGPLGWYRSIDLSWEELGPYAEAGVTVPALYIAGDRDFVASVFSEAADKQSAMVPKLRPPVLLPGCGHWTEQERAPEVSAAMIDFLRSL